MSLKPGSRFPSTPPPEASLDLSPPIIAGGVTIDKEPSLWYEQFAPLVRFIVAKHVRNQADQDERCQDAWIRIIKSLNNYDPSKSTPQAWVARLTQCTVIDQYRRREARIESSGLSNLPDESTPYGELKTPSVGGPGGRVDELIAGEEASHALKELASVRPEQAETLRLIYKDGLTIAEASEATGKPTGTTKSLVARGLARIRKAVK